MSAVSAFVATPDDLGRLPRWNLDTPDATSAQTNAVNPATRAVRFFIAADAYSLTNRAAELDTVRACFDQWQAIPGTRLKFEEGGLIDGPVDINNYDFTNVVFWAKTSLFVNGGMDNITGVLGWAVYRFFDDHTLGDCDIALNGVQYRWTTAPADAADDSTYFIETVLLHEIGHLIGLGHSPVGGATLMDRAESGLGVGAGLSTDEIAAVRSLYGRADWASRQGTLQGQVTLNGAGVYGAVVGAEDPAGNLISGTVTLGDGSYSLPALPPATYRVRVTPLDPIDAAAWLLNGADIDPFEYPGAETAFLPSAPATFAASVWLTYLETGRVTAGAKYWFMDERTAPSIFTILCAIGIMLFAKRAFEHNGQRSEPSVRHWAVAGGCAFGIYLLQDLLIAESRYRFFVPVQGAINPLLAALLWEIAVFAVAFAITWLLKHVPGLHRLL